MNMKIDYLVKRDHNIMIFLNKNLKCKTMDKLMPILTYLGSTPFVAAFCSFALLFFGRARDSFGFKVSAAVVVSGSLSQILKRTVNRIRPFLILNNLNIKKNRHRRLFLPLRSYLRCFYPGGDDINVLAYVGHIRPYTGTRCWSI